MGRKTYFTFCFMSMRPITTEISKKKNHINPRKMQLYKRIKVLQKIRQT